MWSSYREFRRLASSPALPPAIFMTGGKFPQLSRRRLDQTIPETVPDLAFQHPVSLCISVSYGSLKHAGNVSGIGG